MKMYTDNISKTPIKKSIIIHSKIKKNTNFAFVFLIAGE